MFLLPCGELCLEQRLRVGAKGRSLRVERGSNREIKELAKGPATFWGVPIKCERKREGPAL